MKNLLTFEEFLNESLVNEAIDDKLKTKILQSLDKQVTFSVGDDDQESMMILDAPMRIEAKDYYTTLKKSSKAFAASIIYLYGAYSNEYHTDLPMFAVISRAKGTTKIITMDKKLWDYYSKDAGAAGQIGPDKIVSYLQASNKWIVYHLQKYQKDGSVK